MTIRKKIIVIASFAVATIGIFVFYLFENSDDVAERMISENARGTSASNQPQLEPRANGDDPSRLEVENEMGRPFTDEEIALKPPEAPWHAWAYSIGVHKLSAEKNGTVEFYGKLVSEEGEPLAGVRLTAEVSGTEPSFVKALATGKETYNRSMQLTTDQNGRFEITDIVGRRLTVTAFQKPGYEIIGEKKYKGVAAKKSWSYSFLANSPSSFRSDPENPEVFTMKKVE